MQAAAVFYDSECVGVEGAKNRIGFMIMEICCASFNHQELHLAADFPKKKREEPPLAIDPGTSENESI
jgi:hypothetical protein